MALLPSGNTAARAVVDELEASGHTVIVVLVDEGIFGVVALTDRLGRAHPTWCGISPS